MDNGEASLIRVEEQLKESAKNQASIMADLKEIFGRLEKESKITTILSGDLKAQIEASKFRWETVSKRLDEGDKLFKDISKSLSDEKEDRGNFEQEIKGSIKTLKWVIGTLATLATVLSSVIAFLQFIGK